MFANIEEQLKKIKRGTVDVFPETLGRKAAELLLKVIRNEVGRDPVAEHVDPRLVIRESVCGPERHLDPAAPGGPDVAAGSEEAAQEPGQMGCD